MPGLLGLLGATGAGLALAPALQAAVIPLGVAGGLLLARAWWLQVRHGIGAGWSARSFATLLVSTVLAATLWALRFGGVLSP